jgi:hypothetical protein
VPIDGFAVAPGDRVHVEISEAALTAEVWTIAVRDLTSGAAFSITLPYTSTYATAEWVLETPVVIDDAGNVSVGPMPNVTNVRFDIATTNGANAALVASEEMQLLDFNLALIALPSKPDRDDDGFNDCAYRSACPAPGRELR